MVPFYNQLSVIGQRHINAVLADNSTPDQALKHAQKEIDALLARYSTGTSSGPGRQGFELSGVSKPQILKPAMKLDLSKDERRTSNIERPTSNQGITRE
jgi:hypothetical protein